MDNYLCLNCKENNNGWCNEKKTNGLKKKNIQNCDHYKTDEVGVKLVDERFEELIYRSNDSIELKNIDLSKVTLVDELYKRDEEYKEFADALLTYLWDTNGITREHLKEEACDVIQVVISILKILGIDIPEITEYWNTKHLEKIKDRPRREN